MDIRKLTKEQAIIISGFTGILCGEFYDFHADVEKRLGRGVQTFEFGIKSFITEVKKLYEADFIELATVDKEPAKSQAVPEWISTSERMPEEGEEVLVHSLGQVRQVTRDSKWAGGFKERNCYGWQAAYSQSQWMPKSIELPEQYHFYYENDAKQKAMIEAQEPAND